MAVLHKMIGTAIAAFLVLSIVAAIHEAWTPQPRTPAECVAKCEAVHLHAHAWDEFDGCACGQ